MYCFVFPCLFSIADCLENTTKHSFNLVFLTIILKIFCSQKQTRRSFTQSKEVPAALYIKTHLQNYNVIQVCLILLLFRF